MGLYPYDDETLCRYEEDVSSIRDGITAWGLCDPDPTLVLHVVSAGSLNIKVKSIGFHDTRNGQHQAVKEGQSRRVPQAVISRAS